MTKEEFIKLNGPEAWEILAEPLSQSDISLTVITIGANRVAQEVINDTLKILGIDAQGLLEAKRQIDQWRGADVPAEPCNPAEIARRLNITPDKVFLACDPCPHGQTPAECEQECALPNAATIEQTGKPQPEG